MSDTTTRAEESAEKSAARAAGPAGRTSRRGDRDRDQLFRNAYALMLNTGISAVLGLGFWLAAARYYTEDAVGQGSAAIAAMKLLAGVTAVTLTGALARFVPVAGHTTGRLVLRTYAGSSVVVAVAAGVFLLTLDTWGPSYRFLHGPLHGLGFVAAVVGWSLLTLQDGVLTGLRSALWVPVGNTVFSAAKLLLLVALAAAIPTAGVFVSWVAAIAVSVVPLGRLVFRRLVPRHVEATRETARPATYREMGRFLAGDCTGSLFSLAVVYAVPVIVASQVSAADNAYFYIATTIGGTTNLLAVNMGASLTVEGSHDPARLAENCRAALRRMARIMIPVCLVLLVFAPQILGVFGDRYARAATPLLRWFAVGAALRVVIEVYFAVLRAQSRTAGLAYLQGLLCVLVLGLTLVLLPRMGLTGAGVAEVSSLSVIAAIAAVRLRGVLRARPAESGAYAAPPLPPELNTAPDGDLADLAVHGDRGPGPRRRRRGGPDPRYGPTTRTAAPPHPEAGRAGRARKAEVPGRGRGVTLGLWAVLGVALAFYWVPVSRMGEGDLDGMGGLGLVSVLPHATLLGAALLVVAFTGALWPTRPRHGLLSVALVATVVSLHAVPAVLEGEPRFPTAWQHVGFLDYIGRTGEAAPDLDARWSWPGFFAGAEFLARAGGTRDFTAVLRWWPTAVQLLYLAPMMVLLRSLRASWRAKWTAAWLFALCGWVGQDYFSPQGFTYLFYLLFVAVLLVWFREPRVLRGKWRPGEAEVADAARGQRSVLLVLLLVLFTASVAAHQLTPFMMLGVVTALVLVRRSELVGLPLLCGVVVAVWVGFLAEPYWSGHFHELFGGVGGVGGNVSSSVSGRIEGGSSVHKLVLCTRVALAGWVLAFACWGVLRRRAAGFAERSLVVLTFVPFLGFGMQSYGGEMALRVFMFALPGACALGALSLFPRVVSARRGLGPVAALLAGLVLMFGFLVARWGNETFERVRPGEVAAMEYVYAHDKPTVRVLWLSNDTVNDVTPAMPWGDRDMERVSYLPTLAPRDPVLVDGLVEALREAGPDSYLMVGRGQSVYLRLDSGYSASWERRLLRSLDRQPELRRVLSNDDAALYELTRPPRGPVPRPDPGAAGPRITWTPWSVLGALSAIALIALLTAREVVRVAVRPSVRRLRWLQGSFWFSLPLLAVLLASLGQRFWTMS
ncbi:MULTISPECIES: polysaccharide biosynthesis C-terminal domain-containing protein [unclassified Streptomyces]|uniref:polysaccharide biosynthesis C-terminal domain-containing protein n=1 Tax=unclassified Streptomyces TaxID=2593676 RepID=UPI00336A2223